MTETEVQVLRIRLDPERGKRVVEWARGWPAGNPRRPTRWRASRSRWRPSRWSAALMVSPSFFTSAVFAALGDPFDREMKALIAKTSAAVEPLGILLDVDGTERQPG